MIASIFDNGLAVLGLCCTDAVFTPTVSLNVEYLRPVPLAGKLYVHAMVTKAGKSLVHVRGELLASPDSVKPYATATGIYAVVRN